MKRCIIHTSVLIITVLLCLSVSLVNANAAEISVEPIQTDGQQSSASVSTFGSIEVAALSLESGGATAEQINQLIAEVWNIKMELVRVTENISNNQTAAIETMSGYMVAIIAALGVIAGVLIALIWAYCAKF